MPRVNRNQNLNMLEAYHQRELGMSNQFIYNEILANAEDRLVTKNHDELSCEMPGVPRSTFLMVFSPDGTKVASTHGNHHVYVTDLRTGKNTNVLVGHPRTPWCIAFHPSSNQILATGCLGGQVRIWDLSGGSEVWTTDCKTVIASLAFHPIDRLLVIATFNVLYFWDWSQPKPFKQISTNNFKEKVRYVAFDRLGHKLITGIANIQASSTRSWEPTRISHPLYSSQSLSRVPQPTLIPTMPFGRRHGIRPITIKTRPTSLSARVDRDSDTTEQIFPPTEPVPTPALSPISPPNYQVAQNSSQTPIPSSSSPPPSSSSSSSSSSVSSSGASSTSSSLEAPRPPSPKPGPSGIQLPIKRPHAKKELTPDSDYSSDEESSDEPLHVFKSPRNNDQSTSRPVKSLRKSQKKQFVTLRSQNTPFVISQSSAFHPTSAAVVDEVPSNGLEEEVLIEESTEEVPPCDSLIDLSVNSELRGGLSLSNPPSLNHTQPMPHRRSVYSHSIPTIMNDEDVLYNRIDLLEEIRRIRRILINNSNEPEEGNVPMQYRVDSPEVEESSNFDGPIDLSPTLTTNGTESSARTVDPTVADHNYMASTSTSTSSSNSGCFVLMSENRAIRQRLIRQNTERVKAEMRQLKFIRNICQQYQEIITRQNSENQNAETVNGAGSSNESEVETNYPGPSSESPPPLRDLNLPSTSTEESSSHNPQSPDLRDFHNSVSFEDLNQRVTPPPTSDESSYQSETPFDAMRRLQYIYARLSHTEPVQEETSRYSQARYIPYRNSFRCSNESSQASQPGSSTPNESSSYLNLVKTPVIMLERINLNGQNQQESSETTSSGTAKRVKREDNKRYNSRKTEPKKLITTGHCCNNSESPDTSRVAIDGPSSSEATTATTTTSCCRSSVALRRALCLAKLSIAKSRRSSHQPNCVRNNLRSIHSVRRQRSIPPLSHRRNYTPRYPEPNVSMAPPASPLSDPEIREDMEITPSSVWSTTCTVEDLIRQLHNVPQVRFFRSPLSYHMSTTRAEREILLRLYSIRADLQRMGIHLEYLPRYLSDVVNGTSDTENVFRGRYTLSVILVAIMRHFNNASRSSNSERNRYPRLLNERLSFLLNLCIILTDTLLLNILDRLPPPDVRGNQGYLAPRVRLIHTRIEVERRYFRTLLIKNICHLCNRNQPRNIEDISRIRVNDESNEEGSNEGAEDNSDRYFQVHLRRLCLRLTILARRLESNLMPTATDSNQETLLTRILRRRASNPRAFNFNWRVAGGLVPQVQVNDVPVVPEETVLSRPVRPTPLPQQQRHGIGLFRPRFLHPLYGVAVVEADIDDQQREHIFGIDADFPASICPNHRIQIWNMADGQIPTIANPCKNVVVADCKIHNDASVDISKDGNLLVTLLPTGGYLNTTNKLGVYSIHWDNLGQCLYTASFEQNAVSVSFSATARYLAVGLASRRPSLLSTSERNTMAQLYKLENDGRTVLARHIEKSRSVGSTSINCIRWSPVPGHGLVYATNAGHLKVLT